MTDIRLMGRLVKVHPDETLLRQTPYGLQASGKVAVRNYAERNALGPRL